MNKIEFLTKMRERLEKFGLPKDDINDALSYYEEVFLDAGFGKEEETAAELGDPIEIADGILRDSGIHTADASQFPPRYENVQPQGSYGGKNKRSTENFWLKLILLILTSPIWLPVIITVFAVLFSLLIALIAVIGAIIFSGIAFIVAGVHMLFEIPPLAILTIGIGLMITGLFVLIGGPVFRKLIPACGKLIRNMADWIRGLITRRGGQNNV